MEKKKVKCLPFSHVFAENGQHKYIEIDGEIFVPCVKCKKIFPISLLQIYGLMKKK